ncbi:MAG: hypothetical protein WCI74_10210 [Actinomycetes bacterium]
MIISSRPVTPLGAEQGFRLRFGEEPKQPGSWAGRRLLWLDDEPAYELTLWCGTCPFIFRRLDGANGTVSLPELEQLLATGTDDLDEDVMTAFAGLLPQGSYLPMLLKVQPRLVYPVKPGDYFAEDQVATWGIERFWDLPGYPHTPYYRTFETAVNPDAHLYEFVVPMVPPSWNDPARVAAHAQRLQDSDRPTAVAVSILDICAPAMGSPEFDQYEHWALTHFLLDGHHKLQAAARTGRPLQLLSLLSVDSSLAQSDNVSRVPGLRAQPFARRNQSSGASPS